MAGLVPAIPIRKAHCPPKRDARVKPAHDDVEGSMTTRITIRRPDDWHLHVRDGEMLKATLPFTAKHFGRAILMPNLIPPVRTTAHAIPYPHRVIAALPQRPTSQPLITCY